MLGARSQRVAWHASAPCLAFKARTPRRWRIVEFQSTDDAILILVTSKFKVLEPLEPLFCYDRCDLVGVDRRTRPLERFWPYVEHPEEPTAEELAALDPDLHAALFGPRDLPFSITLVFPPFDGADYERAVEMARQSAEYREPASGAGAVIARGSSRRRVAAARSVRAGRTGCPGLEVLIDDRPCRYARELWLPLVWFLAPAEQP